MIPIGNINPGHASRGFRFALPTAKRGLSPVGEMSWQRGVFSWQRGGIKVFNDANDLKDSSDSPVRVPARMDAGELPLAPTATRPT